MSDGAERGEPLRKPAELSGELSGELPAELAGELRGELLDVARAAARAGGEVIAAARERRVGAGPAGLSVRVKKASDFVTEVDVAAEKAVVETLARLRPDDGLLAEEGSERPSASGLRWVVDPLDGTTNFIHDLPAVCVSIACERIVADGEAPQIVAGAVLDVVHDALYDACLGGGARCNGHAIGVSREEDFAHALVGTGIPFRNLEVLPSFLPELGRVTSRTAGIRRFGSAALDLCLVASGRLEAFWEHGLARWDVAAGTLVVTEAGGRVTDLSGGSSHLDTGDILATNGRFHAPMLEALEPPPGSQES